jgi:hypothetical protein
MTQLDEYINFAHPNKDANAAAERVGDGVGGCSQRATFRRRGLRPNTELERYWPTGCFGMSRTSAREAAGYMTGSSLTIDGGMAL